MAILFVHGNSFHKTKRQLYLQIVLLKGSGRVSTEHRFRKKTVAMPSAALEEFSLDKTLTDRMVQHQG